MVGDASSLESTRRTIIHGVRIPPDARAPRARVCVPAPYATERPECVVCEKHSGEEICGERGHGPSNLKR